MASPARCGAFLFEFMDQIRAWLKQNGAFLTGVALLRRFGNVPRDIEEATRRPFVSPKVKERLKYLLGVILKGFDEMAETQPAPTAASPKQRQEEEPAAIQELRARGKALLKEQAYLNARLGVLKDANDRYELARRIVEEVTPEIDSTYNAIRAFEENGTLPQTPEERDIVAETIAKMKRVDSLKTRLRQLRKTLADTPEGPERMAVEGDIAEREEELQRLQSELGL